MSGRTIAEAILGIVIVVALYFIFTQNNTLSETESTLEDTYATGTLVVREANSAGTEASVALADAQNSATEFADTANSSGTELAGERDMAYASGTELASERDMAYASGTEVVATANENENNLLATATESAMQAENTISDLQTDATTSAETFSSLQADATQFADDMVATVTTQANNIADAASTVSAMQAQIDEQLALISTQTAELDAIVAQATTMADNSSGDDNSTVETVSFEVPDDYVLFRTRDFELYVPSDYLIFDIEKHQDEAIETFSDLGIAYSSLAVMAQDETANTDIIGAADEAEGFMVDSFIANSEDIFINVSADFFLTIAPQFIPDGSEIIEQGVIISNGREFGRIVVSANIGLADAYMIMYATTDDTILYVLAYMVSNNSFEENREAYEASLASFTIHD